MSAPLSQIVDEKVQGVWRPEHDDDGHHYRHVESGTLVDSVTTKMIIEKPHLITWASRLAAEYVADKASWLSGKVDEDTKDMIIKDGSLAFKDVRDGAAAVGTDAHNALEDYINNGESGQVLDHLSSSDTKAIAASRAGEKFLNDSNIKTAAAELIVGSRQLNTAGTLDLLCLLDGKVTILDWKTSNSISDLYALQIALYAGMFTEMTGVDVEQSVIVKLDKKRAKYEVYKLMHPRRAFANAKRVLKVADYLESDTDKLRKLGKKTINLT